MNLAVQPSATPQIHAPPRPAAPRRLNLGCGADIRAGFVNVDAVARPGVDVVHDLDAVPWPFEDDAFDSALCSHVLEHVRDFHRCLLELQRVCRAGAEIEVIGPYFFSTKFAGDPSHRIPFSYRTFDNYTPPRRARFTDGHNKGELEAAGIEPASQSTSGTASTCVAGLVVSTDRPSVRRAADRSSPKRSRASPSGRGDAPAC